MNELETKTHVLVQNACKRIGYFSATQEIAIRAAIELFVAREKGEIDMDDEEIIVKSEGFAKRLNLMLEEL